MTGININNVEFVKSAAAEDGFIDDGIMQVVFAGRSNVGKSSVINRMLNRKNYAYVGATPGKTAHVNYFLIDGAMYLVDLPGYGYAKVSKQEKKRWALLMEDFFASTAAITRAVLIVDSRHEPTDDDKEMAGLFKARRIPLVVIANKCDKLKKSQYEQSLQMIKTSLQLDETCNLFLFSATSGEGKEKLLEFVLQQI